jgi:hypothetical protein
MRTVHHSFSQQQQYSPEAPSKLTEEGFIDEQMKRSIALALVAVGFDGATPDALESFRGEVEQCAQITQSTFYSGS